MNEAGPLLAIRADASSGGGTGHVMRTLAIAQEWIARGGRVCYLSAELPSLLEERLLALGCTTAAIDSSRDAVSTAEQMARLQGAVLLVDHYELDSTWWGKLPKARGWTTAAVNDFAKPLHTGADLRISPALHEIAGEPSGPEFLLIREEVRRKESPLPPPAEGKNLLLVMGGSDPLNVGPSIAEEILDRFPLLKVRAVVGPAATNLPDFEALAERQDRLEVARNPASMEPHLRWADTAIVSPSTTAFEVLHHGIVTGLTVTADNQLEVADGLVAKKCALLLADCRTTVRSEALNNMETLLLSKEDRRELASRGAALVDGLGAKRACDLLGLPKIHFRPVRTDDSRLLWQWANDPVTRAASFSQEKIPWEEHAAWFRRRLDVSDPFWIATNSWGEELGVVRFDHVSERIFAISINLAPQFRGKGTGAIMIGKACEAFRKSEGPATVHAWIRKENAASKRSFEKAGFTPANNLSFPDRLLMSRDL